MSVRPCGCARGCGWVFRHLLEKRQSTTRRISHRYELPTILDIRPNVPSFTRLDKLSGKQARPATRSAAPGPSKAHVPLEESASQHLR